MMEIYLEATDPQTAKLNEFVLVTHRIRKIGRSAQPRLCNSKLRPKNAGNARASSPMGKKNLLAANDSVDPASPELRSGWSLKKTCSSPRELSNGVLHSTYTHRGRVDSRLLVIGSQTASLTPGPSFTHNLCYGCPNGPCEAIFDMYASRPFQRYKEHLKARCFDACNRVLSFRESRRTPKSPFRECEWRPHNSLKVGLRQLLTHTTPPMRLNPLTFRLEANTLIIKPPPLVVIICYITFYLSNTWF